MIEGFSQRLRELRTERGLLQEQVAGMIGVIKSTISTYENGTRQPSLEILVRLANLYHVSTDYLLGKTDYLSVDLSDLDKHEANLVCILVECLSGKSKR